MSSRRPFLVSRSSLATIRIAAAIVFVASLALSTWAINREYLPGIEWPAPPVVSPGAEPGDPPSDAIVLFDGKDLSAWDPSDTWPVADDAFAEGRGDIRTKQHFGDCQLHIEWASPESARGSGQDRGNSGIFFQDRYEIQVLDSYDNDTYFEGQAGAIYKQMPPMVNAMRPPGEWNTYDIVWIAPRFNDDGSLKSPAHVTAFHNGVLILNDFEVMGETPWAEVPKYTSHGPGPIRLQDHGHPVKFRNIWVREIKPIEGKQVDEPKYHDHESGKTWLVSEGELPPEDDNAAAAEAVDADAASTQTEAADGDDPQTPATNGKARRGGRLRAWFRGW